MNAKGRQATKAFQESRASRFGKSRDEFVEKEAARSTEMVVVPNAEVRESDRVIAEHDGSSFVERVK